MVRFACAKMLADEANVNGAFNDGLFPFTAVSWRAV
ncbi:MAG: hypothetical protein JWR73_318 [Tardiphaga sp.]|nr:hypothetical protein [Tardiphaga sp.]MDB5624516.1 hypothetical protein [Tardiphaga sp.]